LRIAGDGFGEEAAVGENGGAVVGLGEAEIQFARRVRFAGRGVRTIGAGQAAFAGAESAGKPGKVPAGNGQPFDSVVGAERDGNGRSEFFGSGAIESRLPGGTGRLGDAGLRAARVVDKACLPIEGVKRRDVRRGDCRKSGRFGTGRRPHRSFDSIESRDRGTEGTRRQGLRD
jgi:hypothetical protein